jgi:hypothetical protein
MKCKIHEGHAMQVFQLQDLQKVYHDGNI